MENVVVLRDYHAENLIFHQYYKHVKSHRYWVIDMNILSYHFYLMISNNTLNHF